MHTFSTADYVRLTNIKKLPDVLQKCGVIITPYSSHESSRDHDAAAEHGHYADEVGSLVLKRVSTKDVKTVENLIRNAGWYPRVDDVDADRKYKECKAALGALVLLLLENEKDRNARLWLASTKTHNPHTTIERALKSAAQENV